MIVTEFLAQQDHWRYGDWLRGQDADTLHLYFGVGNGVGLIESLMDRIEAEPDRHNFLVARNCSGWLAALHIAEINSRSVEFGIIVQKDLRGEGIGSMLMDEALAWARNRGYQELFMHCLARNLAVKHLCDKYGIVTTDLSDEREALVPLAPASLVSLAKEISYKQRNIFHTFLQNTHSFYNEIYG